MSFTNGFYFGCGLCVAFMLIRLPLAILLFFLEKWIAKLRESQVVLHHKIADLKRGMSAIERTLGRDPDTK